MVGSLDGISLKGLWGVSSKVKDAMLSVNDLHTPDSRLPRNHVAYLDSGTVGIVFLLSFLLMFV